jgi:hypothetical protein
VAELVPVVPFHCDTSFTEGDLQPLWHELRLHVVVALVSMTAGERLDPAVLQEEEETKGVELLVQVSTAGRHVGDMIQMNLELSHAQCLLFCSCVACTPQGFLGIEDAWSAHHECLMDCSCLTLL